MLDGGGGGTRGRQQILAATGAMAKKSDADRSYGAELGKLPGTGSEPLTKVLYSFGLASVTVLHVARAGVLSILCSSEALAP